ncbi:hypothetical protein GCM10009836_22700 [Pseudonocardia ailaonensis]|uniref:Uncharacterized protein n=1 Tax=Pseudonocardia ailaonensis TaxID=367279 RepID=A0ABN2MY13_9PSEU
MSLALLREVTGYVAHGVLLAWWLWIVLSTAPQLRRGIRDRRVRLRVLVIKSLALVLTALVVGVIHFWATDWWQVVAAVVLAAGAGYVLHRAYRRLVTPPRHRLTLARRIRHV